MKTLTNINQEEDNDRNSRLTGNERMTFRRTSIVVSTATSSPLHVHKYNLFIRTIDTYPFISFLSMLLMMSILTIIGSCIFFIYRDNVIIDRQGSTLILSSGEGLISKINAYMIDLPESECNGQISTYPDGRYSSNLFDVITFDSEDDFFQPRKCKWVSEVTGMITNGPFSYPVNLVGKCNVNAVTTSYTEGVSIIFKNKNLFTRSSLIGMCEVDDYIRNFKNYQKNKCRLSEEVNSCCPSRSLPNYVAALSGLSSCYNITDDSITYTTNLLTTCYPYYIDGTLTSDCWNWNESSIKKSQCPYVPTNCTKYNAVYDMFTSLMESSYNPQISKNLKVGKLLIPYNNTEKEWLEDLYYEKLKDQTNKKFGGAEIVAYNLRIKTEVFQESLFADSYYLIPITFITIISILLMTKLSLFVSIFATISLFFCFGMSWFIYGTILWIQYAPFYIFYSFSLIVYIGLLFFYVYFTYWNESFDVLGLDTPDIDRLAYVWHHTCIKNFSAGLSCSCCLFATVLFPLPSMKCFGLFSGISVLFVFLLAIFFFPTLILLDHKIKTSESKNYSIDSATPFTSIYIFQLISSKWNKLKILYSNKIEKFPDYSEKISTTLFSIKKIIWLLLLGVAIGIGWYSSYIELDDVASPQLLFITHPFEEYDRNYDPRFRSSPMNTDNYYNMITVFGVKTANTIEPFDPSSKNPAEFNLLNISGTSQQQIMYNFCEYMINEKGRINYNISIQNVQCYPLFFTQWMSVTCSNTINQTIPDTVTWLTPQRNSCCGYDSNQKIYPEDEFLSCIYDWSNFYGNFDTGLWWNPSDSQIKAVLFGMESRDLFSNHYHNALSYWDHLDKWTSTFLRETDLRRAYSTSNLELLRYQRGLIVGLNVVSPLCISIGTMVTFFMSRNIIASISVFFSTYIILLILGGTLQMLGERYCLFTSMSALISMALGCGISSLLSHSFCEIGMGNLNNIEIGHYINKEITAGILNLTISIWFSSLCLLGGGNYFTYAFGVVFIFIVLHCLLFPHLWNLLYLTIFWKKQPFGELFIRFGLTPPPCCLVDNPQTLSNSNNLNKNNNITIGADTKNNLKDNNTINNFHNNNIINNPLSNIKEI